MRSLVVYSSRTGNTRKVAEAIFEILPDPKEMHPAAEAPPPDDFDFIAIGFWVNRGTADADARAYMDRLRNRAVGVFGTLAAYPDSEHARQCLERVETLLTGNHFMGGFLCQGRVDPSALEQVEHLAPETHPMTAERRNRLEEAKKHPDERDLLNAQLAFKAMINRLTDA
jgi:flavodoxin